MTSRSGEPPQRKHLEMFRSVAEERLTQLNLQWVQLEQDLASEETMRGLLRELHTLKGEASLMGFSQITAVVHGLEELLRPQSQGAKADSTTGDLVLRGLDLVSSAVESGTDTPEGSAAELLSAIHQLRNLPGPAAQARPAQAAAGPPEPQAQPAQPQAKPAEAPSKKPGAGRGTAEGPPAPGRGDSIRVTSAKLDRVRDSIGELMLTQARLELTAQEFRKARELTREYQEQQTDAPGPVMRMFTMLLDAITGLESRLRDDTHRVADLVSDLDSSIRELRMVPIRTLFDQYPVAMRELARSLGRELRVEFEGETVEVDRSVLDRLNEPILHLLRNAADHGIEPAEERRRLGKPVEGTATVRAKLNGRMLEVTVSDDGAGIDTEAVRRRAIELGLLSDAQASALTESQVMRTLFQAHMSTRRQVTQISGRGLGLNVVLTSVEALGGTATVTSALGKGTTFHLSVPVALAMTSVVLFEVGAARYALPAATVVSLAEAASHPIISSISGPAVQYSGVLIPIIRLDELLGEPSAGIRPEQAQGEPERLMIVNRGRELLALRGTHHHSEREVVLKSMGKFFARNRLVSAVIPLADGTLALVLSVSELYSGPRTGRMAASQTAAAAAAAARRKNVLVVDDSPVVRDLLAEALRAHGLQVIEAGDGEEALRKMESGPHFDLVVTDIDMPKLDGIGLLQRLRRTDLPRRLPVVVVSMRGSSEDQRRALEAGADAYLVKTDLSHAGLWTMLARFLK